MAIRDIVKWGDPRLVAPNAPVTAFDGELAAFVRDLFDTCWAAPGYGLAAPQVGVNLRVAIVDVTVGKEPSQRIVLVNPRLVSAEGKVRDEEGCLSLPDLQDVVERPDRVTVEAQDESGAARLLDADGLLARAFCHEIDHLDSHLFVDRLSPLKRSLLLRKAEKRRRAGAW